MAARRLLIIMLILLGISTLAAALVPQRTLNEATSSTTTTTTQATTTTAGGPPPGFLEPTNITVGGKVLPVVYPVHVGQQLTLLVHSKTPIQIEIPAFGQFGFAAPAAPARFELLATEPGTFGVVNASTNAVVARIRVVEPGAKPPKKKAKRRARAESGQP